MKISNQKFTILFLFISFITLVHAAEPKVKVTVTANHSDWVYQLGEKPTFKMVITQNGQPMKNVQVRYEIGPEKMPSTVKESKLLKEGELAVEANALTTPGFLRCTVSTEFENVKYEGLATAAFVPEQIQPTTTSPSDFKTFWDNGIAANAKIPMDAKMELLPSQCNDKVNVYMASIQNCAIGMRVYGILCVPKAPGKYPAVLQVPGAGVRPYKGDRSLAEKGVITFQIGIHGVPVNLDSVVYANLRFGALVGYPSFNMDNKESYYYKHVYLGCLRANDFICSLPEFDGVNLMVAGGSQGGALSIVTAALDPRVKALSALYPALCDLNGYQNGRAGGWPHLFTRPENLSKEKIETSRYYDVVNFSKLIKVPGFYSFGFNDVTCPPTSIYSALNSINAPKKVYIVKEAGHVGTTEQYSKVSEFVLQELHVVK
jgi:cephalosporin-C deacetylase